MGSTDLGNLSLGLDATRAIELSACENGYRVAHVFDDEGDRVRLAIKAAIAAQRPLLVRGEPGVGKTQLALAAAVALKRPLVSYVVDGHTESRDLLWRMDSVRRLAEAQLCSASGVSEEAARERLDTRRFVEPGPLWWGFNWRNAKNQEKESGSSFGSRVRIDDEHEGADPANGVVVLIDEIDKADADVPNGLLEALGARSYHPRGCEVVKQTGVAPLVVITTNEERILPEAFVRRCMVVRLGLPDNNPTALKETLLRRGRAHFEAETVSDEVLGWAADMLIEDRENAAPPRPGLAEYIDLLRAYHQLCEAEGEAEAKEFMERLREFTFKKHRGA